MLRSILMENLKVTIEEFNVDWLAIKNRARGTIGMSDSKVEPTKEWKRKILIAEHSILRHSLISVKIENVPFYVMGHFVRHSAGVTPYVKTSRSDRTGVDRGERRQTDPVDMRLDLNIQSVINISRKRLCNQASDETRMVWEKVVQEIAKYDEEIAWACVPEGVAKCGCTEGFGNCKQCPAMLKDMNITDLFDIQKRYDHYNVKRKSLRK